MDNFFNKEFYINLAVTLLLTMAAIFSDFDFDLTVIMGVTWTFFLIIHTIKLFGITTEEIKEVQNSNVIGK